MILILVAVAEELSVKDLPGYQIHYTGVGKINASIKTLEIIKDYSPTHVINYGTAGSLNKKLKGLVEVTQFFQRDMDATPLGFKIGQTPFDEIEEINFGSAGYSCGTGDSFVTQTPKLRTDLVDMEAYAIAKICYLKDIKFRCFKYVSDNANEGANDDWIKNVSMGKKLFIERMRNLAID
jgi:adenosylhomocysteine nucleosidase